ncbi:small, acid-soluble spore protein L [Pontibacillus yanchengensis]|uniref:Small, acid-soluble spore protein L n=2 Tax=Pontibacillus yanchengensis TaxID=462910 RepID=A0ACC7VE17_9BACI|nr:small, acid-soluble spore protein L [Pontibacillus yanchengensis]MYL52845.1 small, acid-soluble spore protein L [Pontibacillus yanchengensis]
MSKRKNQNKGKMSSNVNPQGFTEDKADQQPKSKLEERAKKSNTKL